MYLFSGDLLVSMGNYLLLFIYCLYTLIMLCFLLSVFLFSIFFFPATRTNSANVVNQKQSVLDATAIGNSFLHKH